MHTVRVSRGLDLPIAGSPVQQIEDATLTSSVAVLGADYVGMRPTMAVEPGERVKIGQTLFTDKKTPGVVFTSPACGTVTAINRGAKRVFLSIVIALDNEGSDDDCEPFTAFATSQLGSLSRQTAVDMLVGSGVWTSFRTRPFNRIPSPTTTPHSIFVTAIDTNPSAADPAVIIAERREDFSTGLLVITRLEAGNVFLCKSPNDEIPGTQLQGVETVSFAGPHPAGLPGTHIHTLDPAGRHKTVWHIGYQDVIAIGHLFRTGRPDTTRVVALAGPGVNRPRLIRTHLGANLAEITAGQLSSNTKGGSSIRVISGSVLSGRDVTTFPDHVTTATRASAADSASTPPDGQAETGGQAENPIAFLGRYHLQVSAISDPPRRELFGWIMPGFKKFSLCNVVASKLLGHRTFAMDTAMHGGLRAIVPIGAYEKVMPLDILPTFLFRALSADDIEQSEALGCLELDEDDLALCTFVCPGKIDFGAMLRRVLNIIEKEG